MGLYKVIEWEGLRNSYHRCQDLSQHLGRSTSDHMIYVDLFVDGDLAEFKDKPEELVGRIVEINSLQTFLYLAEGVSISKEKEPPNVL